MYNNSLRHTRESILLGRRRVIHEYPVIIASAKAVQRNDDLYNKKGDIHLLEPFSKPSSALSTLSVDVAHSPAPIAAVAVVAFLTILPPLNDGAKTHSRRSRLHRAHGGLPGASMSPRSHFALRARCASPHGNSAISVNGRSDEVRADLRSEDKLCRHVEYERARCSSTARQWTLVRSRSWFCRAVSSRSNGYRRVPQPQG